MTSVLMATERWSFDTSAARYRDGDTGRFLSNDSIVAMRDAFLDSRAERVDNLAAQLASGRLTLGDWEVAMREEIKITFATQYVYGRGGLSQMQPEDWGRVGALVKKQYGFLSGFADDIADGKHTADGIANRAGMYVGSSVQAHAQGQTASHGMPDLDQYPGDGQSSCQSACRCRLVIKPAGKGIWNVTWVTQKDSSLCDDCEGLGQEWNPLVVVEDNE